MRRVVSHMITPRILSPRLLSSSPTPCSPRDCRVSSRGLDNDNDEGNNSPSCEKPSPSMPVPLRGGLASYLFRGGKGNGKRRRKEKITQKKVTAISEGRGVADAREESTKMLGRAGERTYGNSTTRIGPGQKRPGHYDNSRSPSRLAETVKSAPIIPATEEKFEKHAKRQRSPFLVCSRSKRASLSLPEDDPAGLSMPPTNQ